VKKPLTILTVLYGWLLSFYPRAFREEFGEEMLLDFGDKLESASLTGIFPLSAVLFRELRDIPINLLKSHWKESRMIRILSSQPVNHALRGSLGYGLVNALAILISWFVSLKLVMPDNSIIGNIQVFYFDLFHTEHGLELISWIPNGIGSLLTGLILGILFAVLFADRSKYKRYILAGMLGWFLHDAIGTILDYSINLEFFLGARYSIYFRITEMVLSGAFLALSFVVAKSEKSEPIRWLIVGSFAYPLITYFYLQLLLKFSVIETPWMFIALMVLMVVYIGSVFIFALRSDIKRNTIWMIIAGALGYALLPYATHIFLVWTSLLIPYPDIPSGVMDSSAEWRLMFRIALDNLILGMIFGLIMGLMFWFQKKNSNPQILA
jgi:hypothetical protein